MSFVGEGDHFAGKHALAVDRSGCAGDELGHGLRLHGHAGEVILYDENHPTIIPEREQLVLLDR
jgi:hypothetical protein